MDAKTVLSAYAKSRTVWGGLLQWALSGVLALMASGTVHKFKFSIDENAPLVLSLDASTLFAAVSACLGLVLYGRNEAQGPLLSGKVKDPGGESSQQQILAVLEQAIASRKNQPIVGATAPEGAEPCDTSPHVS